MTSMTTRRHKRGVRVESWGSEFDPHHQAKCNECPWTGAVYSVAGDAEIERRVHERTAHDCRGHRP